MSNPLNSSQQHGRSNQESRNSRPQPGLGPEVLDYFLSGEEASTQQKAEFSEILIHEILKPFTALCRPPYNLSDIDAKSVVFSWTSATVIESMVMAGKTLDPANNALTDDLQKWNSACPGATQLFNQLNYEPRSDLTSAKGKACKAGEHIWKREVFRGDKRSYRQFHRHGLVKHDLTALSERYHRVVERVNAVKQSRPPPQSGQRTQSTFPPNSVTYQSTMPQ